MFFCKIMAPNSLVSRFQQSVTPTALRSYAAEFISTFFYVFSVVGSSMASQKLMPGATATDPSSLLVAAVSNVFALAAAVYLAANISGGHVNPAVTFGMAVSGHVSVPTALFYWFAQMFASVMACIVLRVSIVGQHVPSYAIAEEMTGFGASIVEGILTFALVYTVFAASDVRRGPCNAIGGAVMVGLMAGANVLAAGPFSGGSVNPACAFGSAIVSGSFKNQAVYWVGPLIGAALAGIVHDNVVFPAENIDSFRGGAEAVVV